MQFGDILTVQGSREKNTVKCPCCESQLTFDAKEKEVGTRPVCARVQHRVQLLGEVDSEAQAACHAPPPRFCLPSPRRLQVVVTQLGNAA